MFLTPTVVAISYLYSGLALIVGCLDTTVTATGTFSCPFVLGGRLAVTFPLRPISFVPERLRASEAADVRRTCRRTGTTMSTAPCSYVSRVFGSGSFGSTGCLAVIRSPCTGLGVGDEDACPSLTLPASHRYRIVFLKGATQLVAMGNFLRFRFSSSLTRLVEGFIASKLFTTVKRFASAKRVVS